MKRAFGFIAFVLAIIGGLNAIGSAFQDESSDTLQQIEYAKEAEGFAAAFTKAYLSLPAEEHSILPFTNLRDIRPQRLSNLKQEVIGIWALQSEEDSVTHVTHIQFLVQTKTIKKELMSDRTKETLRYWKARVQVTRDLDGRLHIFNFPSLNTFEKGQVWLPEMERADSQSSESMKPMLESFFRAYLSSSKPEDIANFFRSSPPGKMKGGNLSFESLEKVEVYGSEPWLVFVDIKIKDPITEQFLMESYQLDIVRMQGKYYIDSFVQ